MNDSDDFKCSTGQQIRQSPICDRAFDTSDYGVEFQLKIQSILCTLCIQWLNCASQSIEIWPKKWNAMWSIQVQTIKGSNIDQQCVLIQTKSIWFFW